MKFEAGESSWFVNPPRKKVILCLMKFSIQFDVIRIENVIGFLEYDSSWQLLSSVAK